MGKEDVKNLIEEIGVRNNAILVKEISNKTYTGKDGKNRNYVNYCLYFSNGYRVVIDVKFKFNKEGNFIGANDVRTIEDNAVVIRVDK